MRGESEAALENLMVDCCAVVISGTALYLSLSPARGVFPLWEWKAGALSEAPVILNLTTGQSNDADLRSLICLFRSMRLRPFRLWNAKLCIMRRLYRAARYLLTQRRRSSNETEGTEGFLTLLGLPSSLEGPRREWFCSG